MPKTTKLYGIELKIYFKKENMAKFREITMKMFKDPDALSGEHNDGLEKYICNRCNNEIKGHKPHACFD